jgi:hypothetical protein
VRAFHNRRKVKAVGFPNLRDLAEGNPGRQTGFAIRADFGSVTVKKSVKKGGGKKSTGVRFLHFRTGCFGGESAPKWYRKGFYMDSFKRNGQRKNKTKPAHFSGCRGALRMRHGNRSFSAPTRPHL